MKRFGFSYFFGNLTCYFNLVWHYKPSDLFILDRLKLRSRLTHWAENSEKNDEKMIDLKFIRNHSRKVPGAPGHQNTSSNIILSDPGPSGKNWKNWHKLVILTGFGTHFSHFCHADACVALRYSSCSLRVIRRQSGPSLNFQKLRHLDKFGGSKLKFWEIYEKVWLRIVFPI